MMRNTEVAVSQARVEFVGNLNVANVSGALNRSNLLNKLPQLDYVFKHMGTDCYMGTANVSECKAVFNTREEVGLSDEVLNISDRASLDEVPEVITILTTDIDDHEPR